MSDNLPAKREQFALTFERQMPRFADLLPASMAPADAVAQVRKVLMAQPDLLDAEPVQLVDSFLHLFRLGIRPEGYEGEGWIIPYRDRRTNVVKAQPQVGYKGLLRLLEESQNILRIKANVVYRQEVEAGLFEYEEHPATLAHRTDPLQDRGSWTDEDIVGAYALIELEGRKPAQVWVSRADLNQLERSSANRDGWKSTDKFPRRYAGMARKTAILQLFHRREVPLTPQLRTIVAEELRQVEQVRKAEFAVIDAEPSSRTQSTLESARQRRQKRQAHPAVEPQEQAPEVDAPLLEVAERQALVPELYDAAKAVGIDSPKTLFAELEDYFGRELPDGPKSLAVEDMQAAIEWLRSRGGSDA